jgi:hypothetical protein
LRYQQKKVRIQAHNLFLAKLLREMKVPQGETPISIVEWNAKSDPIPQVISRVFEEIPGQQLSTVATWTKD